MNGYAHVDQAVIGFPSGRTCHPAWTPRQGPTLVADCARRRQAILNMVGAALVRRLSGVYTIRSEGRNPIGTRL